MRFQRCCIHLKCHPFLSSFCSFSSFFPLQNHHRHDAKQRPKKEEDDAYSERRQSKASSGKVSDARPNDTGVGEVH